MRVVDHAVMGHGFADGPWESCAHRVQSNIISLTKCYWKFPTSSSTYLSVCLTSGDHVRIRWHWWTMSKWITGSQSGPNDATTHRVQNSIILQWQWRISILIVPIIYFSILTCAWRHLVQHSLNVVTAPIVRRPQVGPYGGAALLGLCESGGPWRGGHEFVVGSLSESFFFKVQGSLYHLNSFTSLGKLTFNIASLLILCETRNLVNTVS